MITQIEQQLAKQDVAEVYEEIVGKSQAQVERERMEKARQALEMELQRIQAQAKEDSLFFVVQTKQDSLERAEQIALQRQQEIELLEAHQKVQELAQSEQEAKLRVQQTIIIGGAAGVGLLLILTPVSYTHLNIFLS